MTGQTPPLTRDELVALVGTEIGVSRWFEITQGRIDAFAEVTGDRQFIHIDPAAAAATPFGGTIAHGFLTASLLAPMAQQALPKLAGRVMGINYGFDKLRFLSPVRSGSKVRGRFTLTSVEPRGPDRIMLHLAASIEIEGETRPALAADWLSMSVFG